MTPRIKFHEAIQSPQNYAWGGTEQNYPCKAIKGKRKAILLNPNYAILKNGGHDFVVHVTTNMACPRGDRQFVLDQIEFNRPKYHEVK
jgi:hypothetical protein